MDDAALAKLEKLAEMKSKGILTEEEFAQQKAAVLGGSASNQVADAPGGIQPIMMQPGMMGNQRPPPPGCPPGGQFLMVKYKGPMTQQAQQSHSTFCCILGILCGNPICCLCAACPPPDLKDEKDLRVKQTPPAKLNHNQHITTCGSALADDVERGPNNKFAADGHKVAASLANFALEQSADANLLWYRYSCFGHIFRGWLKGVRCREAFLATF